MQTHLALRTLKGTQKPDRDVQVLFAVQPNQKAVLFIHGFSGDAIKTWSDFHELLPNCVHCACRDLIFYGYDGLRAEMHASASIFRGFLNRFFETTKSFLEDNLPLSARRPDDFRYDELTIVAHSLGAVIARRALLDATKSNSAWTDRTKLVLYAPAHKGAKVAVLALEAASSFPFLKLFGVGARFESPLIDQLKPGSQALISLLEETSVATKDGANPHLVARRVVIAEYEKIVQNESFCIDPPPDTIPETTHTSVCKPRHDFLQPLTLLEGCL
jgi:alpha-beta hydrolase superfamily lysophospholipase